MELIQDPLENAMGVDENGMTTTKKLYAFLKLNPANYSRWVKKNVENNHNFFCGKDYFPLDSEDENPLCGRPTANYEITSQMAKHVAMTTSNFMGKVVRRYFIEWEKRLHQLSSGEISKLPDITLEYIAEQLQASSMVLH